MQPPFTIHSSPSTFHLGSALAFLGFLLPHLIAPSLANAHPAKRFHEGPYLQLTSGVMQSDHDGNVRTGQAVGHDLEPTFGFCFGWNVTDPLALEIAGRYATAAATPAREHLMRVNINVRWNWILPFLTNARPIRFLPFLQAGPLLDAAILPGDPATSDLNVTRWGGGGTVGSGVSALIGEYVYLSVIGQADVVGRTRVTRAIAGVPTEIYAGGWTAEWSGIAALGVHF